MMNKEYTRTNKCSSSTQRDASSDVTGPISSPDSAMLACRESAATLRSWIVKRGMLLTRFVVLSAADNRALRSPAAIVSALPPTVTRLFLDDVEALLPLAEPGGVEVLRFVGRVASLAALRGIHVTACLSRPGQPLKHFLFPINKEGRLL